ncbi:MAG: RluA family pseudouridine synthase [Proteobacteria bacterium]|nr:RluA family pseudouridine synthase [Pseudomonadota bacterium]MBU1596746.1 RluA family pseudouridine synthase [Pseudomonadota bacterium]
MPDDAPRPAPGASPPRQPLVVSPEEAGQKLLQFLTRRLAGAVPGSALLKAIRTGQVRVDGGRKQPFFRLAAGQEVRVPPFQTPPPRGQSPEILQPAQELLPLDILYEDQGLLAVAKPAGLCAHAGTRHPDSVADRLKALYAGAPFLPVLAHRLDKDTSGILLAAKSYAELRRLGDLFASGGVAKTYLAWVDGAWPGRATELLEDALDRLDLAEGGAEGRKKIVRADAAAGGAGKQARCEVTPLVRKRAATLLKVRLLTGRTHQIRVQLSLRGHAIISDAVYGRKVRGLGMMLHALSLRLPERALFLPPPWSGPFALPEALLASLRETLGA